MIPAQLFLGAGTVINALCIVVGAAVGTLFGEHLPSRVRDAVTPVLGLVVVTIGGLSIPSLLDASVPRAVGQAGVVIVLLALVIGTMLGAWSSASSSWVNGPARRSTVAARQGRH
ncbi:Putative uncharacterized protein [Propionibacterium freudenreichii]|nr:DUF554 family protein [Propionibacterium freudenreichii]CEG90103.1 Putative uncharacterized protein [Propionibacterium freudenreichii]